MLMMLLFFRRQIYIIKLNEYVWVVFAKCAILSDLEVWVPTPSSFKHSRSSSGHAKKNCKLNRSCIPHTDTDLAPPLPGHFLLGLGRELLLGYTSPDQDCPWPLALVQHHGLDMSAVDLFPTFLDIFFMIYLHNLTYMLWGRSCPQFSA